MINKITNKKYLFITCTALLVLFLLSTSTAYATGDFLEASPQIIDIKSKQREIIERTITIKNTTTRRLNIYTFIEDLSLDTGKDVEDSHNSNSLIKWMDIPMGVIDLDPGQSHEIDWKVIAPSIAEAGIYHARISFGQGSTREIARHNGYEASIALNFEILSNVKENLQLKQFISNSSIFLARASVFSFDLENAGNTELAPNGQIRIYNRKGRELGAVDVNREGLAISGGEFENFEANWDSPNLFGKYKAVLDLNYGKNNTGNIQDTVFFWSLSWKGIVISLTALFSLMFFLVFLIHRKVVKRIHKQLS